MNQELIEAILCTLRFHHNMLLFHVFGCCLCLNVHIETKPEIYLQHEKRSLCYSLDSLFHISSCLSGLNVSYLTDSYIRFTLKMESVIKNTIYGQKMMMKSGLEKFILKSLHVGRLLYRLYLFRILVQYETILLGLKDLLL